MPDILIAPSVLASDFSRLGDEIEAIDRAGADWVHLDVMDGHFVPNISFGASIIKAVRPRTTKVFDSHLMIAPADPYLAEFADAGSDLITVHAEAGPHLHRSLQTIKGLGKRAGVAINPGTSVDAIRSVIDMVDLVLLMTVNPGFGGQKFIKSVLPKIREVHALVGSKGTDIQVDGGVTADNAAEVAAAGANVLVAGSAVFKGDYATTISAIRAAAQSAYPSGL